MSASSPDNRPDNQRLSLRYNIQSNTELDTQQQQFEQLEQLHQSKLLPLGVVDDVLCDMTTHLGNMMNLVLDNITNMMY